MQARTRKRSRSTRYWSLAVGALLIAGGGLALTNVSANASEGQSNININRCVNGVCESISQGDGQNININCVNNVCEIVGNAGASGREFGDSRSQLGDVGRQNR